MSLQKVINEENIKSLIEGILHGDDEHQEWLDEAIWCWFYDKSMPEPRGSGTKDRLYKHIQVLEDKLKQYENNI